MTMDRLVRRLVREEEGQDLIEYALLAAFLALAAATTMGPLGGAINTTFTSITTTLNNAS